MSTESSSGAVCIYWGIEDGHVMALLHHRKDKKYGIVGGYAKYGEPFPETARRETAEELKTHLDTAIFTPDETRYEFLADGTNHQKSPPVRVTCYTYQLSAKEIEKIKDHIHVCQSPACCESATQASDGETMALEWLPLDFITQHLLPKEFTHPSHHQGFCYFAEELERRRLKAEAESSRNGKISSREGIWHR